MTFNDANVHYYLLNNYCEANMGVTLFKEKM